MKTNEFRKNFREQYVPRYYNGYLHVFINFGVLGAVLLFLFFKVQSWNMSSLAVLALSLVVGNFAVYFIHRFLLHQNLPVIGPFTYKIHSLWHHRFYTHQNRVFEKLDDLYILFFPPTVVLGFVIILLPIQFYLLINISIDVAYVFMLGSTLTFLLYEVVHFCSHLPESHPILKIKYFKMMWVHHGLHHNPELMHKWNFNIVLPLADWVFGTVYEDKTHTR